MWGGGIRGPAGVTHVSKGYHDTAMQEYSDTLVHTMFKDQPTFQARRMCCRLRAALVLCGRRRKPRPRGPVPGCFAAGGRGALLVRTHIFSRCCGSVLVLLNQALESRWDLGHCSARCVLAPALCTATGAVTCGHLCHGLSGTSKGLLRDAPRVLAGCLADFPRPVGACRVCAVLAAVHCLAVDVPHSSVVPIARIGGQLTDTAVAPCCRRRELLESPCTANAGTSPRGGRCSRVCWQRRPNRLAGRRKLRGLACISGARQR